MSVSGAVAQGYRPIAEFVATNGGALRVAADGTSPIRLRSAPRPVMEGFDLRAAIAESGFHGGPSTLHGLPIDQGRELVGELIDESPDVVHCR
jgi:hypothetical protein